MSHFKPSRFAVCAAGFLRLKRYTYTFAVCLAAMVGLVSASLAHAEPIATYWQNVAAQDTTAPCGSCWNQTQLGTWSTPMTQSGLASFAYGNSVISPGGYASATIWSALTNDGQNVGLHIYSQTTSSQGSNSQALSEADLAFQDTFYVTGETGQTGSFRVNITFEGAIDSPYAFLLAAPEAMDYFEGPNPYGGNTVLATADIRPWNSPQTNTYSYTFTESVGDSFTLGLGLQVRNDYAANTSTVDNAAFFTVTPMDSGIGFTSESGLSYASVPNPVSAPEPETYMMLLAGLGLVGLEGARRKFKK